VCCTMLHCVSLCGANQVCCSVLHYVALCCTVSHCVVLIKCVAVCCTMLQCVSLRGAHQVCCSAWQCHAHTSPSAPVRSARSYMYHIYIYSSCDERRSVTFLLFYIEPSTCIGVME